jgi:RimJ/RimL family protein N-acetyltransferase
VTPIEFPPDGLRADGIVLRLPTVEDVALVERVFGDEDIAGRANLPPWSGTDLEEFIEVRLGDSVAAGAMIPMVILSADTDDVLGGASIQNIDLDRSIADLGYWLLPEARGRGVATRTARAVAEYGFSLGVHRIQAYVNVGNVDSERVLERAGFTREGVLRSMPRAGRSRVDQTLFSLLQGE